MTRTPYREKIIEITKGIVSTLSDYLLIQLYFGVELMGAGYGSRNVYRASDRAWEDFFAGKKRSAVRQNLYQLKSKGLITYTKGGSDPQITEAGRRRLRAVIPFYDEKRVWDGKLYLVTFDIPEDRKYQREVLREYLKKIGCGMFQWSVWLTPYDPRRVLRDFVSRSKLEGMVVVSDIGKDGSIGGEDIKDIIARVFKLNELNKRYVDFVARYEGLSGSREKLAFDFLPILKDDPQLPFALLPKDWLGEKAYKIYLKDMRAHTS